MRLRLIFSFVLIVLVAVTSVVLIARTNTTTEVRSFMFHGGMTGTDSLVQVLQNYYQSHGSWDDVAGQLDFPGAGRGRGYGNTGMMNGMGGMLGQRLRLADAGGNILLDTQNQTPVGQLSNAEKNSALPVEVDGQLVGYLLAEGGVGANLVAERFLLNRLSTAAITAGLIAGGLALLLALFLTYSLMRPVRDLTRAARRLGAGDLSQRVQIKGNDELAVLGSAFNHMADSLQQAQASRRSMTADIAHELRNPLAVQRANLEAMQDGVFPLTPQALDPVLEQNLLLTRLVDDLRTLALAEAGQLKLERQPVDLAGLVERIVERFKPQAAQRQVTLRLENSLSSEAGKDASGLVELDPLRVEQILNNLLSNALRFAPPAGEIVIGLARTTAQVQVSVRDSGPGIPEEALPHIFERFYRADRSRSRSEGGTGLGLAIALHLAEAHGGTLVAANSPQGGAVFTLSLPLK
jgi:two-component system, OmpR family, sensor histidine kinase BaeS